MKKLLAYTVLTLLLVLNFNVQDSMAKITKDQRKISFAMTEDNTGFFMSDDTNPNYYPTWLYYRFTIFNAEGCTLNIKLQRITLGNDYYTLSEKEFTGNHFDFSAADKVAGTPFRNHYLDITKVSDGCKDVKIKGFYGFEHEEPDW
ncbi:MULTISPECIES: hypothetical protein [Bacillus]|uniref:YoaW n=1 Tax=Bacillus glycinifermentans TaxID=1664069 RepID=A0AAJ3YYI4_9BACI|nr:MULTISPECIES: hypothetical protein [Bacillus]KKB71660.1 hypothetical protein TH62_20960 [Bacillus sp. TH008]MDU0069737.1 hypothetical protein [Bacillus sp. IG6]MED8018022.1 hypothetical protein [Bacillus glycinifermentans]QAT65406.1 hypothetical protein EQZ20_11085 [Bacillus glycinifermentans]WKB79407.1 hypothetical protein QYM22_11390 [Bacillus glycinifermentans]